MNIRKHALAAVSTLFLMASTGQHAIASSGVFEQVSNAQSSFRVLERAPKAKFSRALASRVSLSEGGKAETAIWDDLVATPNSRDPHTLLDTVQSAVNTFEYIEDGISGTPSDHWARPAEFLARQGGDCEDFAITKYAALAELGFAIEDMAVMVYIDRTRSVVHAVLLVDVGDETYVLDSLKDEVVPLSKAGLGRPLYVVNEQKSVVFL